MAINNTSYSNGIVVAVVGAVTSSVAYCLHRFKNFFSQEPHVSNRLCEDNIEVSGIAVDMENDKKLYIGVSEFQNVSEGSVRLFLDSSGSLRIDVYRNQKWGG